MDMGQLGIGRVLFCTRLFVCVIILASTLIVLATPMRAESDDPRCNNFLTIQSIILSEATRQPLMAQIEVARVAITKGVCFLDGNFYTGYGVALRHNASALSCLNNWHCRAYFMPETIDPRARESAALAAHIGLTEVPRIPRFHFDNWQSHAAWWNSPRACPFGNWTIAELRVC